MSGEIPGAGQVDAIASPGAITEPLSELSPRQEDRLRGFDTLVERISTFQEKINNGEYWEFFVKDEQENKVGAVPITQETIEGWKETAFHMYEDFQGSEPMAQRAKAKVEQMKAEEEQKKEQETQKLANIWDKGTEW